MSKAVTPHTSSSAPDATSSAGDAPYVALTFEDRLRIFWQKNSKAVIALVVLILVGLVIKGFWEYSQAQKEIEMGREFAAATTPEKLNAFATAHSGHMLAGVARLRAADLAYAAGKSADAVAGYEQAAVTLKSGPLASRARLGLAMARIQAGKTADGEASLKQIASDTNESKGIRVEASYHLASLASAAGRAADVRKYGEQIMQIDPMSPWTQRVFLLQASLPPTPVAETSGIALPKK